MADLTEEAEKSEQAADLEKSSNLEAEMAAKMTKMMSSAPDDAPAKDVSSYLRTGLS